MVYHERDELVVAGHRGWAGQEVTRDTSLSARKVDGCPVSQRAPTILTRGGVAWSSTRGELFGTAKGHGHPGAASLPAVLLPGSNVAGNSLGPSEPQPPCVVKTKRDRRVISVIGMENRCRHHR